MRRPRRALICFLYLLPASLSAQVQLSGRVFHEGERPMPAKLAEVRVDGTDIRALTDARGRFMLRCDSLPVLLIARWRDFQPDSILASDTILPDFYLPVKSTSEVIIRGRSNQSGFSRKSIGQLEILGQEEFRKAACCNLSESFETNASVEVSNADGMSGIRQVEMLGLAGKYVQLNRDNVPLIRGLAQVNGLTQVPGPFISSVLISKGTGSVMNGFEGLTGSINYSFRTERNEPPWFFNAYAGNMGRFELNARHRVELGPRSWYTGMVHGAVQSGRPDMNHDGFLDIPIGQKLFFGNQININQKKWESQISLNLTADDRQAGQLARGGHYHFGVPYIFSQKDRKADGFVKLGLFLNEEKEASLGNILSFHTETLDADFGDSNLYRGSQNSFSYQLFYQQKVRDEDVFRTGFNTQYDDVFEIIGPNNPLIELMPLQRREFAVGPFAEYTLKAGSFSAVAGIRSDRNNLYGWSVTPRLHLRYDLNKDNLFRIQAGYGRRTAWVLAENLPLFLSNRQVRWQNLPWDPKNKGLAYGFNQERGWNFGASYTRYFKMGGRAATFMLDYFETRFDNQVIADRDEHPNQLWFYQKSGGFARAVQAEWNWSPRRRLDIKSAYRFVQNVLPLRSGNLIQPLLSPHRFVLVADFTNRRKWHLNNTFQINSPRRIPQTLGNPEQFRRPGYSPWFVVWNAQLRKEWKGWEWYIGGENLLSAGDRNPVLSAANPYLPYFDASLAWGPVMGANFYAGVKLSLK